MRGSGERGCNGVWEEDERDLGVLALPAHHLGGGTIGI